MIRFGGGIVKRSTHWIKGFFSPSHTKTSITIDPPSIARGLSSIIGLNGKGSLSAISSNGAGITSTIYKSIGISSIIQTTGIGILSEITEQGTGVTSV